MTGLTPEERVLGENFGGRKRGDFGREVRVFLSGVIEKIRERGLN